MKQTNNLCRCLFSQQAMVMAANVAATAGTTAGRGRAHPSVLEGGEPAVGYDAIATIQSRMRGIGLEGPASAQTTRRRGAMLFVAEPNTRPVHITDKKG